MSPDQKIQIQKLKECGCSWCESYLRDIFQIALKEPGPARPHPYTPGLRQGYAITGDKSASDANSTATTPKPPLGMYVPSLGEKSDGTNPKDLLGVLKLPLRFIPAPALAYLAKVMELGARKYGPFNWRKNKVKRTVYLEAALRHILTALDGEDIDAESGEPHEAHAMACMGIILDAKATGNLIDDRFTPGVFGKLVQIMQKKVA